MESEKKSRNVGHFVIAAATAAFLHRDLVSRVRHNLFHNVAIAG